MNFLYNAIKFTNKNGSVSIKLNILEHQSIENEKYYIKYMMSFKDNGVGISLDGLKSLFLEFHKLDESSKINR